MEEVTAKLNYLQMSPIKVRKVADVVRGMKVEEARIQLQHMPQKASEHILKLLNSAAANAENNFDIEPEEVQKMKIATLQINKGPVYPRLNPRAQGRADTIERKSSHINIALSN